MALGADDLLRLSSLLDQAMDLDDASRQTWLAGLDERDASLRPVLARLLAEPGPKRTDEFIERGPSFTGIVGAGEPPVATFSPGERIGPYRLERPIGQGGMGEVWLAVRDDGQLKRAVALKLPTLSARRAVLVQRFARERDILGSLAHPHIARLYDAGVDADGQPYLALEYVEGQAVTEYCDERKLDLRARVRLLLQVLAAVQYAHANLVIHRDLKPSNVLVTAQGQAMLLDFGIAKLLLEDAGDAEETELTRLGGRAMTLAYAAPEQVSGAPISIATDVWALGVLLYQVLSGARPYAGKPRDLERAILEDEPARPQGLPADLATIVLKALKKPPAERYATVDALAEDLQRWLDDEPVLAQPDSAWYRARKFVGRHKAAVATAVGVMITVVVSSGVSVWQARVARTEAQTAEAVQSFMENIFRASSGDQLDPIRARQRTAKELLDEGAARIDTSLDDAPQAKLRIMKTLGDMYEDTEQIEEAAALYERRASFAHRVYAADSSAEMEAQADLAYELVMLGRLGRAAEVLAKASAIASRGSPEIDARFALYRAQANLYQYTDMQACIDASERALKLLRQRTPTRRLVEALGQEGSCLASQGKNVEALVVLREGVALAERKETAATSRLVSLRLGEAEAQKGMADLPAAEASYRAAIESARRYAGADSQAAEAVTTMLGQFLGALPGRSADALQAYADALAIIRRIKYPSLRNSELVSTVAVASYDYLVFGRLAELSTLLDEVSAIETRGDSGFEATLRVARANVLIERGRYEQAREQLDAADAMFAAAHFEPGAERERSTQARVKLETHAGKPAAAEAARLAWRLVQNKPPIPSPDDARGLDYLCQVRVAQNRLAEANGACSDALAAQPDGSRRLRLGMVLLQGEDPAAALPMLRQAVAQLSGSLDPQRSPEMITARAALGRALLASGDAAGATEQVSLAREIAARCGPLAPYYLEPLQRVVDLHDSRVKQAAKAATPATLAGVPR